MDITIHPRPLRGKITIIPSKSQAHRLLICAALANNETELLCPETNRDIEATAECLRALGTTVERTERGYHVTPATAFPRSTAMPCRDSGSTLRFLLPIVGALGIDTTFQLEGRLPSRPLSPLWEELERTGCTLTRPTETTIRSQGKLRPGRYAIDGGVSSQFITGLLFALSLIDGETSLDITGNIQSKPYIDLTRQAMALFGAPSYHSPGFMEVEGDWSNGAFFLAAQELGSDLVIQGLDPDSPQGDRAAAALLPALKSHQVIDAADIPDLVPILAVVAACNQGATFQNIQRLRLKESDRVESVLAMIQNLGGTASATEDTLTVSGTGLSGGTVDAVNDHRIAMAAAIGATVSKTVVTVLGAECTQKSYPQFWAEYRRLGGHYEQHLR